MPIPLGILAVAGAGGGGAGGADFVRLETTILSSPASTVTFSSLGSYSQYKHLQIRATMRETDIFNGIRIRFNGDTGTNYANHYITGDGSSVSSTAFTSTANVNVGASEVSTSTANAFNGLILDLLDFNGGVKNPTARIFSGSTSLARVTLASMFRNNTAAVTSISFVAQVSYATGCRFSLYGIK